MAIPTCEMEKAEVSHYLNHGKNQENKATIFEWPKQNPKARIGRCS